MLRIKTVSLALGIWAAVNFIVCVLFGLFTPEFLHMHVFLEHVLPGFQWISAGAFVLGLVESFLFGIYAGVVFVPIYNWLAKRFDRP